jgi:hypothetical protein
LTAAGLIRRSSLPKADPPPPRRAAVASARAVTGQIGGKPAAKQPWQDRVFDYRDEIGEVRESAEFFGRNLARVRLLIQVRDDDGEWVEATEGEAVDALDRLRGPAGDADAIKASYGELLFLVGEGYLFGLREQGSDEEVWEFLSTDEVKLERTSGRAMLRRKPSSTTKASDEQTYPLADTMPIPEGQAIALRLWNPHPRYSDDADAPMRSVLGECEELRLLSRAVRSRARSRLASAGLLAIPSDLTVAGEGHDGMEENPEEDHLLVEFIETAGTAIRDEESAAAVVPIIVRADGEDLEHIQHVKFVDPAQAYPETEREVHVIQRFAQGVSLPVEIVTGVGSSNHWSAWAIDEDKWTSHLEPVAKQFCTDVTSAYLWPQLTRTDPRDVRVWYDPAGMVVKPDRAGDARELHDRIVISDEALREANGFDENDEPDEEERRRRIGRELGEVGLATGGEPTGAGAGGSGDDGEPPAGPATTEKGPPDPDAATAGAVRVALARCRQAAGARVLTRLQREAERPDLNGTPQDAVCAALGGNMIARLGLHPHQLVKGGAACLVAAGWSREMADLVEDHAARTLFDDRPPAVNAGSG